MVRSLYALVNKGVSGVRVLRTFGMSRSSRRDDRSRQRGLSSLPSALALLLAASGCASCSPQPSPTASVSPTASATPSPLGVATSPSPAPATLAGCPATQPERSLPVLARLAGDPDDVTAAPDGSIWVSDSELHALAHLSGAGAVLGRIAVNDPEGTVVLADGILAVADQAGNRVVVMEPMLGAPAKVLASLPAVAGQLGVDGIGYDAATGQLLVPDSPAGRLYTLAPASGALTLLASGMGRIVDAAIGSAGVIYAVAETARGLQRVPRGGGASVQVGRLSDLDDVVALNGLLYVTDLSGSVWAVDPTTGGQRELVSQAAAPQGLAVLAGRLLLVDETSRDISWLRPCA
jgi:sugar lactone lactonase YvrE